MRLLTLRRARVAEPGTVSGTARLDRRTKRLVGRLRAGDIAVIDHIDLDRVAADSLVAVGVVAVLNAKPSISGRYPNLGPEALIKAGITLIDDLGEDVFRHLRDGETVRIEGDGIFVGVKPFIRTAVRVRCALSAKPAACAARVTDAPSASRLNAVRYRCHSRYRRIGTPTWSRNRCWSRLSDRCAMRVRSSIDGGGDGVVRRWFRTAAMRSS